MSASEETKRLPVITRMPVVTPGILQALREERGHGGETYFWSLGADLARGHSQHRETYEQALRNPTPPETPDATSATVLLVLHALDMQAKNEGYQLPEIPSPINPLPALREFIPRSNGTELGLINIAYTELIRTNPVLGDIVKDIEIGAPDEPLRIMTETQAKRGAVYAYYGVKSILPK